MNQDRFNKIDSLLEDVIDLPTLEREEILDERCKDDSVLKAEVLEMVSTLKGEDDFIENSKLSNIGELFDEASQNDIIGKKIDVYRLKELIGRGGMSVVYKASRTDDFEKEVAIKIIPQFDKRERLAENFRRERQILANLSHPYIAQILDGGTTADNKPYLVMEYVDGIPLDEFCKENDLSETKILELFKKVCEAVTFAHANFIVHRDLKPQNILITKDGTPKLLDFGIAKLLDNENSLFADNRTFDGNALTLEYASPEQITGGNITAASDVYSLGVILYKLLTGKKPRDLKDKSLAEIVQTITTTEPIAPSQIKSGISKMPKSELDYITLRALANSPKERYKSVEEFENDIENYLNSFPVSARPASSFYQFKKYIWRRKIELTVASVLILTLFGWLATSIFQTQAARETARKNRQAAYSAEMVLAAKEYENANLTRVKELLKGHIPKTGEEDIRGFEWYFLNNLANPAGEIKTLSHPNEIWGTAFSPDGKLLATASHDNKVRVWDIEKEFILYEIEQKGAWKVDFFSDGKKFVTSSSSKTNPVVKIYETKTGREIHTLRGHSQRVRAVAVSPDGKWVASGGYEGIVILWDAEMGKEFKRFKVPKLFDYSTLIHDVSFSNDGSQLAVVGLGIFSMIDTKNWEIEQVSDRVFDQNTGLTRWKIEYSPTENVIAVSTFSGVVFVIDSKTLKVKHRVKTHDLNIKSIAFTNDGKTLITSSWDRMVKFINVDTGEIIHGMLGHTGGVHDVSVSPDGKTFATASADFKVKLWKTDEVLQNSALINFRKATTYDKVENAIYVSEGETVRKIDLNTRKTLWEKNIKYNDSSIDYSRKANRLILAGVDGIMFHLNAANGEIIKGEKITEDIIDTIKISPDGERFYVGYRSGFLQAFETKIYKHLYKIKAIEGYVRDLDISPDGKLLAVGGSGKSVKILNAETGKAFQDLPGNIKPVHTISFSPDGKRLLAGGADEIARIWRVSDGELLNKLTVMNASSIAFSPDGKRIATGSSNGVIRLWNTESGQEVLNFTTRQKNISRLFFSANSKKLISVEEKLQVWQGG